MSLRLDNRFFVTDTPAPAKTAKITNEKKCSICKHATHCEIDPFGQETNEPQILVLTDVMDNKNFPLSSSEHRKILSIAKKTGISNDQILWASCIPYVASNIKQNLPALRTAALYCQPAVIEKIKKYKNVTAVIPMGHAAVESIMTHLYPASMASKSANVSAFWRGFHIPDANIKKWICPTMHPRDGDDDRGNFLHYDTIWRQDMEQAFKTAFSPFPDQKENIVILEDKKQRIDLMRQILSERPSYIAIDYETSGLKPHDVLNHHIYCLSLCFDGITSYAMDCPQEPKELALLQKILQSNAISKIAHNMKFEHMWTKNILGYDILNWFWDTMIMSHILNNQKGVTGLKFQTYVNFGIAGYEQEVSSFLRSKDSKNGNAVNQLAPYKKTIRDDGGFDVVPARLPNSVRNKILYYCAQDSLYTYRLFRKQYKEALKEVSYEFDDE